MHTVLIIYNYHDNYPKLRPNIEYNGSDSLKRTQGYLIITWEVKFGCYLTPEKNKTDLK